MKQILFATGNVSKPKRFSKGLLENGKNAIENALIIARAFYKASSMTTFAMDDNLYIDNIPDELQPGMFVRRINGKRLNDDEMIEHYSNLAKKYGDNGRLTARWLYGLAVIKDGKENTYTWSKEDFYIVDKPCDIINKDYPLNSISINKKLNKYFTDLTDEDKKLIQEDETDVVEFITKNV